MSTAIGSKPRPAKSSALRGQSAGEKERAPAERDHVRARRLRHGPQPREDERVAQERRIRGVAPVGEPRHGRLQVENAGQRHLDHPDAEERGELPGALAVRAAADADVEDAVAGEDVAAVERPGRLDPRDLVPERSDRCLGALGLGASRLRAGPGHHRSSAPEDERVLDERGVGTAVRRRHLDGLPPGPRESRHVRRPLLDRQRRVERQSLDVRHEPVGENRRRPPDERYLHRRDATSLRRRVRFPLQHLFDTDALLE